MFVFFLIFSALQNSPRRERAGETGRARSSLAALANKRRRSIRPRVLQSNFDFHGERREFLFFPQYLFSFSEFNCRKPRRVTTETAKETRRHSLHNLKSFAAGEAAVDDCSIFTFLGLSIRNSQSILSLCILSSYYHYARYSDMYACIVKLGAYNF